MTFCFEKKAEKKKPAAKPVREDPPDIIFELEKDLKLTTCSNFGLTKFNALRQANTYRSVLPSQLPIGKSIINIIRDKKQACFEELQETSVTFGFAPEAAKTIENLKKELKRKNIKLRVDVGKEDLNA